jgi:hypothetical protein
MAILATSTWRLMIMDEDFSLWEIEFGNPIYDQLIFEYGDDPLLP